MGTCSAPTVVAPVIDSDKSHLWEFIRRSPELARRTMAPAEGRSTCMSAATD